MPPIDEPFPTAGEAPAGTTAGPRQTLAMRLAARNGQRELRAARLARLRAGPCLAPASLVGTPSVPESSSPDPAAATEAGFLEVYLRGLSAPEPAPERPPKAVPEAAPAAGAVLPFHAPHAATVPAAPEAASDLVKLPGAGPGLVQALGRAGLVRLADLAPLEPEALATRLGPIGRLIPARAWIAAARAAADEASPAPAAAVPLQPDPASAASSERPVARAVQAAMLASWTAIASSTSSK